MTSKKDKDVKIRFARPSTTSVKVPIKKRGSNSATEKVFSPLRNEVRRSQRIRVRLVALQNQVKELSSKCSALEQENALLNAELEHLKKRL